jgi:hypothetical protein
VTLQADDTTSAVPRSYVDTISGALDSRIDALAGAAEVTYGTFSAEDHSIEFDAGTFAVSSAGGAALSIKVAGYSTISSNAQKAQASSQLLRDMAFKSSVDISDDTNLAVGDGITLTGDTLSWASGSELHSAWVSTQALQDLAFLNESEIDEVGTIGTGTWEGTAVDYNYLDGTALPNISSAASKAYASAQALEDGAFKSVASGWFYASDQSIIPHTLSAQPTHVTLTPSGAITYATAFTADATNIVVRVSHAGQRSINWRAEV